MTRRQEYKINLLIEETKRQLFFGDDENYEFKKFDVREIGDYMSVVIETGRKNDEGTCAEIYCRDHLHIFVGPRGGVSYYGKGKTRKHLKHLNLLETVIAQRI